MDIVVEFPHPKYMRVSSSNITRRIKMYVTYTINKLTFSPTKLVQMDNDVFFVTNICLYNLYLSSTIKAIILSSFK